MPQTLLALLALTLASFLALNQQRLTLRSQTNMVTDEVELAAAALASEALEFVGARAYDELTTPRAIYEADGAVPASPSAFSETADFGAVDRGDAGCDYLAPALTPACDDIDDVAALGWTPVEVDLAHGRALAFEIRTDVYYVDDTESMTAASGKTIHKRVVLDVRSDHVVGDEAEGLLRMTRVFSYDPVKADMDYENDPTYGPGGTATAEETGTTTEGGPDA